MVGVLGLGQAARQFPFMMIVDIGQAGDAMAVLILGQAFGFQPPAQDVAHRLGSIAVAALTDVFVELGQQVFIQRYGKTIHKRPLFCLAAVYQA